jgi:hypothetical protein
MEVSVFYIRHPQDVVGLLGFTQDLCRLPNGKKRWSSYSTTPEGAKTW